MARWCVSRPFFTRSSSQSGVRLKEQLMVGSLRAILIFAARHRGTRVQNLASGRPAKNPKPHEVLFITLSHILATVNEHIFHGLCQSISNGINGSIELLRVVYNTPKRNISLENQRQGCFRLSGVNSASLMDSYFRQLIPRKPALPGLAPVTVVQSDAMRHMNSNRFCGRGTREKVFPILAERMRKVMWLVGLD